MTRSSRLAYIQTRIQARHGDRPSEDRWRLLEATPDLGSYLQAARATCLRPWVSHFSSETDTHRIERSLRSDWSDYVTEIASWCARDWQQPVEWLAHLPYLPFFVHQARGEPAQHWMRDDAVLAEVAQAEFERRGELLLYSALWSAIGDNHHEIFPISTWLDAWEHSFPRVDKKTHEALGQLRQAYESHAHAILDEPHEHPLGPPLRHGLHERLNATFRNYAGRIPAVFAHLGLMALDIERLRGALVLRALFRDPARRPQWA